MAGFRSDAVQFFVAGSELGTATTKASVRLVNTPLDITAFLNNAERQNPNIRSDAIEWAGFFDDADKSIDGLMSGSIGTVGDVVSFAVGTATGNRSYNGVVQWRSAGISARIKDMVRVDSVWQPDQSLTPGKHFGKPVTIVAGTGIAVGSIDDSALSTGTGTFYVHVTGYAGGSTAAFTLFLAHSTDGTTFANKASYIATATGSTAIAFTGTLNRYTDLDSNLSSAGTVRVWAAYQRP